MSAKVGYPKTLKIGAAVQKSGAPLGMGFIKST